MNNIKKKLAQIDRRKFLQGAGVAVGLPLLDFMFENKAYAQTLAIAKRYLMMFNGVSIGRDGMGTDNFFVPKTFGTNYELNRSMLPMNDFAGLQEYISVASNLLIPYTLDSSGNVPTAGIRGGFHGFVTQCQLIGMAVDANKPDSSPKGPSSDRLLKNRLGYGDPYKHINFSVQPSTYREYSKVDPTQYDMDGIAREPQVSPQAFFTQMFGNFVDTNSEVDAARRVALQKRKSILDLIDSRRIEYLNKLVSVEARQRLEVHFDHIRDIESQLESEEVVGSDTCIKPQNPGPDPQAPNDIDYSDEERRATIMTDLIAMAFACDISRIGTMSLTAPTSFISGKRLADLELDYHEMSHGSWVDPEKANALAKMQAWHIKHYCRLLDRLRSLEEGEGNILDNSAILLVSEGGSGANVETGDEKSPHSTENMCTLIAGKAGGLKGGVHIDANRAHPTRVLISGMKAAGMTQNTLNQVSGTIGDLFV